MGALIDHTRLHRTARYFMHSGRAVTHDHAMDILRGFGASIRVGPEVATSIAHQVALLTLVNLSRRALLGDVEVLGAPDAPLLIPLVRARNLADAVVELGGKLATTGNPLWPVAQIGTVSPSADVTAWQLTWQGWRGGGSSRAVCLARNRSSDSRPAGRRPLCLEPRRGLACKTRASLFFATCPLRCG